MSTQAEDVIWQRHTPPLTPQLEADLVALWERVFSASFQELVPVLRGDETGVNNDVFYVAHCAGCLAGSSHLTFSAKDPRLGGLGEVAVDERYRRRGLATELCRRARDEFFRNGGQGLFLGTTNPAARRIYESLGWQPLSGSTVMVCTNQPGRQGDAFLEEWFQRSAGPFEVRAAGAETRIPMIPLALAPTANRLLDINTRLFSTAYVEQNACLSLYPRYQQVSERGATFAAWSDTGTLLGLATVNVMLEHSPAEIGGFAHPTADNGWNELLRTALEWSKSHGLPRVTMTLAVGDNTRQQTALALGFTECVSPTTPSAVGLPFKTIQFERSVAP